MTIGLHAQLGLIVPPGISSSGHRGEKIEAVRSRAGG